MVPVAGTHVGVTTAVAGTRRPSAAQPVASERPIDAAAIASATVATRPAVAGPGGTRTVGARSGQAAVVMVIGLPAIAAPPVVAAMADRGRATIHAAIAGALTGRHRVIAMTSRVEI